MSMARLAIFAFLIACCLLGARPLAAETGFGRSPEATAQAPGACGDLVISTVQTTPGQPTLGRPTEIYVAFKNQGNLMVAGFRVYVYVDPDVQPPTAGTLPTKDIYYGLPILPGEQAGMSLPSYIFQSTGPHVIYAWVDPTSLVTECDETNNLAGPVALVVTETPDLYEPDDSCEQAPVITAGGSPQDHNLSPALDRDWVTFPVTAGTSYHVQAVPGGNAAGTALELYSNCDRLTFDTGDEFTFTAWLTGSMFLRVKPAQAANGTNTAYRLQITTSGGCGGFYEPNNSCALAGDIGLESLQTHSFCSQNDQDWARLEVEAGASYAITATNIGSQADALLSLYSGCDQQGSFGDERHIEFTAPTSGVVYLQTEQLDPEVYGASTEYTLEVHRTRSGCAKDSFEKDDDRNGARTLPVDQPAQTHDFCPAGDEDWTSFQASAGTLYAIETFNLGSDSDTVVCLYDTDGRSQIRCDDDAGEGRGSKIVWQAERTGAYFLRVTHRSPDAVGAGTRYDLQVTSTLCQVDAYEPNDSMGKAAAISSGVPSLRQNTCPRADEDWFVFEADAGPYFIETTQLGPEADTALELYDSAGRLLEANDDFEKGGASRISRVFEADGAYFARVRHRNAETFGTGTEYVLRLVEGTPPPSPATPTPTPTPTPSPSLHPGPVRTVVLVNPEQVVLLHGETQAAQLMDKLNQLAAHDLVKGEVLRLDEDATIRQAYAVWNQQPESVESANQVAGAIRALVMNYLGQHQGIEYLVLVGDDRLLPFRRIQDHTPKGLSEQDYAAKVDPDHPTGAAIRADYFLSDDYYADRAPAPFLGRELYVPEYAVGRLVESPQDIIPFIDNFLAAPVTPAGRALVTGYDFLEDVAAANCRRWQDDLDPHHTDCQLIGDDWILEELRALQLQAVPSFKVQSINGHANHYAEGTPVKGNVVTAQEIAAAPSDLSGGLIYTPGCQSGLNVPPTNSLSSAYDLPEAFTRKLANYVANTGYGWGFRASIAFSEKLVEYYTEELSRSQEVSIGEALVHAKQRYVAENAGLGGLDEKVLEELTLYGLPMYRLHSGGPPSLDGDPFPSIQSDLDLPQAQSFETGGFVAGTLSVKVAGSLTDAYEEQETALGSFLTLDGHVAGGVDQPLQPLYFADVSAPHWPARGVLLLEGAFKTRTSFDPVMLSPINEYVTATVEAAIDHTGGWQPDIPVALQGGSRQTNLVARMAQFQPQTGQLWLYEGLKIGILYGTAADDAAPDVSLVDAAYREIPGAVELKVGAGDDSGISRVVVTYVTEDGAGGGRWQSADLARDETSDLWTGVVEAGAAMRYIVQVVDGAGNVTVETNKGQYYAPARLSDAISFHAVFLPVMTRPD